MVIRIDYLSIYLLILYISAATCLITSISCFKRKPAFGAFPLGILLVSVAEASFLHALVYAFHGLPDKLLVSNLRYIGIQLIPFSFLALTYEHSKKASFFKAKRVLPILSIAFVLFILVMTNQYHFLFYRSTAVQGNILVLENGMGFWLNVVYMYTLSSAGIIYLVIGLLNPSTYSKRQTFILLLSTIFPFVLSLVSNLSIVHIKDIDVTPLAFSLTGLMSFFCLFGLKMFDVIPIAKGELFESLQDSVVILDKNDMIMAVNKQALNLFNSIFGSTNPGGYTGKAASEIFSAIGGFPARLSEHGFLKEKVCIHVDSELKYFFLFKNPIFNKKDRFTGSLIILKDITELELALREAKFSQKAAEDANQSKSRFLANMSHEIRTPMNAILGISDILYSTDMPADERKKNLKILTSSATSLLYILNDILDYSKIEAGKLELEHTVFHLREILAETVDTFVIYARNKNISIETSFDTQLPEYVSGDPTRLKQVFSNLISNSLKFTEQGQIDISARVMETYDNRAGIEFIVSDTGIGIPDEKISNLFESFKQLDNSTTRKYGGTGLGLAIVKSLVEMMGGSIRVESKMGAGSSFIFQIPFEIAQAPKESAKKIISDDDPILSNINIIVAEDSKVNQDLLRMLLAKKKLKADFADNGKILLQMLELKKYELVLMDMQMPEIDGLEATSMIREKEKETGEHMIIIALTANAMKGDRELCINSGMDDYLAKPLRYKELSDMIGRYFG